jgi:hypothetical protein
MVISYFFFFESFDFLFLFNLIQFFFIFFSKFIFINKKLNKICHNNFYYILKRLVLDFKSYIKLIYYYFTRNIINLLYKDPRMKTTYLCLILILYMLITTYSIINIPQCAKSSISIQLRDRDGTIDPSTNVIMCHDTEYLYVTW